MADYKHNGMDSYGYVEEINFTPLSQKCEITYTPQVVQEDEIVVTDSFVTEEKIEQNNLTIPNCKCLRK